MTISHVQAQGYINAANAGGQTVDMANINAANAKNARKQLNPNDPNFQTDYDNLTDAINNLRVLTSGSSTITTGEIQDKKALISLNRNSASQVQGG